MDPTRASLIRYGMEISELGMKPGFDPHDLIRFALARLAVIARDAGVECKIAIAREHGEADRLIDDIKADRFAFAQRN